MEIKRWKDNPILASAADLPWCRGGVRNPGAVLDNGKVKMLFTANSNHDSEAYAKMRLGFAESEDGVNFDVSENPFLDPSDGDTFFDRTGIDDPRITPLNGYFYFTYASPSPLPDIKADSAKNEKPAWLLGFRRTGLARTKDWKNVERLGPITSLITGDANVVLFPEKIGGTYAMLHRPTPYVPWIATHFYYPAAMWLRFSDDLHDWGWNLDWDKMAAQANKVRASDLGDDHLLIKPEFDWERLKVGASGVPIPTDEGWLMLYHAVDLECAYRVGVMLLDRADPRKVIARSPIPVFEPVTDYEKNGIYPNCVFPCSNVVMGDEIFIYYGASDSYCALATVKLKSLLDYVLNFRKK
jgi:predicted GH43/DUF377 family glycosyl hydrolase